MPKNTFETFMQRPRSFRGIDGHYLKLGRRVWRIIEATGPNGRSYFGGLHAATKRVGLKFPSKPLVEQVRATHVDSGEFEGWILRSPDGIIVSRIGTCYRGALPQLVIEYYGQEKETRDAQAA